jgi:hypothetical protein
MVHGGEQSGLAFKPREAVRILRQGRRHDLDGDGAVKLRIPCEIHHAHPAAAKLAFDGIRAQLRGYGHRSGDSIAADYS